MMEKTMRLMFVALLFLVLPPRAGMSDSGDSCGPGCHLAPNGGCVVDGWEVGAPVWNECPAGLRPKPPCGAAFRWSRQAKACLIK